MAVFYNDPGDLLPCPEKHTLVTVAFRGDKVEEEDTLARKSI